MRLVDGGSSPPGLLFAALVAATVAAFASRKLGTPAGLQTERGTARAIEESAH
jgi:hypothetical protein